MTSSIVPFRLVRAITVMVVIAFVAGACSSSGEVADTSTTTADENSNDAVPAELAETFDAIGNPNADVVVINAQGGPTTELQSGEFEEIMSTLDLDATYAVNVHQAQTLNSEKFIEQDIDFEAAKTADAESVSMISEVVKHFVSTQKRVYVVGISFGAFIVEDLLATQGNIADGYLVVVGRLDMPDDVWKAFSEGKAVGFTDGVNTVDVDIDDAGMGAGSPAGDRNMARLAAGIGYKRFTTLLADVDLKNTIYVYGETDEQVGRLNSDEIAFLEKAGANIKSDPGGHGDTADNHVGDLLKEMAI